MSGGPGSFGRLRSGWRRIKHLVGDRTTPIVALATVSVGTGFAEAGVLALVAQISATMIAGGDQITANVGPIDLDLSVGTALAVALVLAVVRTVLQLIVAWLPSRISADVQCRLRSDLFASFTRASWPLQADEREGHLQELITSQVSRATETVIYASMLLSSGAIFISLTVAAFVVSVPVALAVLVTTVALFLLLRPLSGWGRSAARDNSKAYMDLASGVSEAARLAEEAQVFGAAEAQTGEVGRLVDAARHTYFRFELAGRLSHAFYQSLVILLIVGGLVGLYATGAGDFAGLGAAVLMLVRAASYGQQFQGSYHGLVLTLPYLDRVDDAIRRYRESAPAAGGRPLPTIQRVDVERLDFRYGAKRPVLRDVNFSIEAGETIGIVGPSGAGKSTLVQVLLRLREPDAGAYLINGEPVQSFSLDEWRRRVAYVAQEPRVFQGTVADNIRYHRDIDADRVEQAARLAHIHADIMAMPKGYQTVIGQRSDAVSGGQRQRICLARALADSPDLLVLDEPTSALDLTSESAVQASLSDLHGRVTMFIVAHRLSTLNTCDRILVLANGQIEAFAPGAELELTNEFFRSATALTARP